jgi:hypothetical protein
LLVAGVLVAAVLIVGCGGDDEVTVQSASTSGGLDLTLLLNSCTDREPVVEVTEDPGAVRVRVSERGSQQGDCADAVTVTLDRPVGDRQLVDDVEGAAVYVEVVR